MKIAIGTDLVSTQRFKKSILSEKFLQKVFQADEINECLKKANPCHSFAARFAAKEASLKALGSGLFSEGLGVKDIWVKNDIKGKPYLCFSDLFQKSFEANGFNQHDLSLSHHGSYAIATVIFYSSK